MSKSKKRTKKQVESIVADQNLNYDIVGLLRDSNTQTKPNMAKFLEQYVKDIHSTDWCRIFFYPTYNFKVNKFLIRFNDMHDLICWQNKDGFKCTLEKNFELEEIPEKNMHYIQVFFEQLLEFGFIYGEPRKK